MYRNKSLFLKFPLFCQEIWNFPILLYSKIFSVSFQFPHKMFPLFWKLTSFSRFPWFLPIFSFFSFTLNFLFLIKFFPFSNNALFLGFSTTTQSPLSEILNGDKNFVWTVQNAWSSPPFGTQTSFMNSPLRFFLILFWFFLIFTNFPNFFSILNFSIFPQFYSNYTPIRSQTFYLSPKSRLPSPDFSLILFPTKIFFACHSPNIQRITTNETNLLHANVNVGNIQIHFRFVFCLLFRRYMLIP